MFCLFRILETIDVAETLVFHCYHCIPSGTLSRTQTIIWIVMVCRILAKATLACQLSDSKGYHQWPPMAILLLMSLQILPNVNLMHQGNHIGEGKKKTEYISFTGQEKRIVIMYQSGLKIQEVKQSTWHYHTTPDIYIKIAVLQ